jgi:hypothetical protein
MIMSRFSAAALQRGMSGVLKTVRRPTYLALVCEVTAHSDLEGDPRQPRSNITRRRD